MAVNKVEINGDVKIDLTSDTVTADSLEEGLTAHAADGETIVGLAKKTWTGTKAQYETEKNNIPIGTLVCITDDYADPDDIARLLDEINGTGLAMVTDYGKYEEGEHVIGTYLGKKLYRMIYSFPANSGGLSGYDAALPLIPGFDYTNIDIFLKCAYILVASGTDNYARTYNSGPVRRTSAAPGTWYAMKWADYNTSGASRVFTWVYEYTKVREE